MDHQPDIPGPADTGAAHPLPVQIVRSPRRRRTLEARLVEGTVRVLVPDGLGADEERRLVAGLVARVTARVAAGRIDLAARARVLARRYGLPEPRQVEWSSRQSMRWGSCSPAADHIRISDRLATMPPWVLDGVLVHELAHLVEPGHGPRFRSLVGRYHLSERAAGYLMAVARHGAEPGAQASGGGS